MLVRSVTATATGTNCWVLAPRADGDCLVVDPGIDVLDDLAGVLAHDGLRPRAVLVTHGHLDHVWSVTPLSRGADPALAVHVHPDDRYRLRDPLSDLPPGFVDMIASATGIRLGRWEEPAQVVELPVRPAAAGHEAPDGVGSEVAVEVAGVPLLVRHAPGHTEGSVCFRIAGAAAGGADLLLSGDVLFAGSVGRTDLPGGDATAMTATLAALAAAPYGEETVVLPGHGPATTMGAERRGNPFLRAAASAAGAGLR